MGSKRDEVSLTLQDSDEGDTFSGFSDNENQQPQLKSVVVSKAAPKEKAPTKEKTHGSKKKGSGDRHSKSKSSSNRDSSGKLVDSLDISKLSQDDISKLRELLGIQQEPDYAHETDVNCFSGNSLENLPRMTISVDASELSDGELPQDTCESALPHNSVQNRIDMAGALFGEEQECDEWDMPRLKAPTKGKPISESLAKMINIACTTQCETDSLITKYSVPENCEMVCPPLVNTEIWKVMNKRTQSQDRLIVQTQNLVAAGMTPIIRLAEVLKTQISANAEAKSLLSDALTLIGQVQFNLSVRRRYMIRPALKKKYYPLCNISQPVTTKLFGDEVAKEIKACDSMGNLSKYDNSYQSNRGRGGGKFPRRGGHRGGFNNGGYDDGQRYQPYPQRGQYRGGFRNNSRNFKKPAASTPPNPNE